MAGVFWWVKCVKANDFSNSHGDDILNIKVLQRGHIRVFTSVCLQNQLLNDPVQQQPVVQHSPALFICTGTHTCVSYSMKAKYRQVGDQWRCAYRASRGSAAGSTASEGMLQCGSGSSWSAQTSGWHSWSRHGPGGTQLKGVHISTEMCYPEYRMKEDEAINETHNIKAFGHEKLVFIPQHLKEVQMPANTSNKCWLVTAADRPDPPAAPMGEVPPLQHINSSFYNYLSRVAFSCACSLSIIGWMPNIRNS